MANSKISALTDGNPAQSGDEIPIARSGANYKITVGSITSLGGDVDGPASATDNAVARFDGTTGKLIQNSAITIEDDGSMVIPANSTNAGLRITQTGTGNALSVEDDTNPDATPFVVNADGRVAIGNTTALPAGAGLIAKLGIANGTLGVSRYANDSSPSVVDLARSRNTTIGSQTIVQSGDGLGVFYFSGSDGTGLIRAASILAEVDGTPGTNDMPGRLVFSTTADGASTPTERMRIDSAGRVGIGGVPFAGANFVIPKTVTGATNSYQLNSDYTVASDVTSSATTFFSYVQTQAAAFTLGSLNHFFASQRAIGAGSTITNQYGFIADASLTGATNNYGFYSDIASGTNRWNFYANGTASNFFGGNTIISVADNTNAALRITQTGTGDAILVEDSANPDSSPFVVNADGRVLSGLTTPITTLFGNIPGVQINAQFGVQAMAFSRFSADQFGADIDFVKSRNATVGSQTVLVSGDQIANLNFAGSDGTQFVNAASIAVNIDGTPGTNDMPGRLVFSTTADGASSVTERMRIDNAGSVGIGATSLTGWNLRVSKNITGGTSAFGVGSDGTIQSGVTSDARMFFSQPNTAATAFTLTALYGFSAAQGTIGAGSSVTNQYGFFAGVTLTGATNNYGFYSNISSGTGRWNFYANGTAENYLGGNLKIGGTAARATTAGTNQLVLFDGTAPVGTLTNGVSFYSASGEARVMDSAGNSTLLSPHDAETNEWIYHSVHTPTGKKLRIDMEKMMRFLNEHFGLDFIHEE